MYQIRWDKDLEQIGKGLRTVLDEGKSRSALYRAGKKLLVRAERIKELSDRGIPEASGDLLDSGKIEGPEYTARTAEVDIVYTSPHAINVHEGRRAGAKGPPKGVIADWISTKGVESDEYTPLELEFLISRSIKVHGIKPNKFLERAYLAERRGTIDAVEQEYVNAIRTAVVEQMFKRLK